VPASGATDFAAIAKGAGFTSVFDFCELDRRQRLAHNSGTGFDDQG
jgi:hypothetical protein